MGKSSRDKGQRGEREFAALIREYMGHEITRQLGQERDGGADIVYGGYAIQVKRCETLQLAKWWEQTCNDAFSHNLEPALAYRQNRGNWRIRMRMRELMDTHKLYGDEWWCNPLYTEELSLDGFFFRIRESGL